MKDHKMQRNVDRRPFKSPTTNDRCKKAYPDALSEDSSTLANPVSLPKKATFEPKTPLGKKLLAQREKIIEAGVNLLTFDEIIKEVDEQRGRDDN